MKKNMSYAYLSVMGCMLFWAVSYVWVKVVYQCYNPITTVFLRLLIAAPLTWGLAKLFGRLDKIQRKDYKLFIGISLLQPFLYFLFESFGLKYASSTVSSVIISTIPLLVPVGAYYYLQEKMSPMNMIGMAVSFLGVLMVVLKGDLSLAASALGLMLLFAAVVTGVTFTLIVKKVTHRYSPLTIVTYQNLIGILWFLPLFLFFDLGHFMNASPGGEVLFSLLLLALLPTSLAFILFAYSIRELGAVRTSMFGNIMPVMTAVFAWMVLGETLTLQMTAGIALVIAGLFVAQKRNGKKNQAVVEPA